MYKLEDFDTNENPRIFKNETLEMKPEIAL